MPVFERAKTVYALDRAATVIGLINIILKIFYKIMPLTYLTEIISLEQCWGLNRYHACSKTEFCEAWCENSEIPQFRVNIAMTCLS
jgi:hypothetical protein